MGAAGGVGAAGQGVLADDCAEICQRHGVLLIADEVMTGFGRTGRRFAVDHWNVMPDILIGGKGLTGGYMPMGMIAVRGEPGRGMRSEAAPTSCSTPTARIRSPARWPTGCSRSWSASIWSSARPRWVRGWARSSRKSCRGIRWSVTSAAPGCSGASRWCATAPRARRIRPRLKVANRVLAAAAQARAVRLSGDRDGAAGGGDAMMVTPPFVIGTDEIEFIVSTAPRDARRRASEFAVRPIGAARTARRRRHGGYYRADFALLLLAATQAALRRLGQSRTSRW